MKSTRRRRRRRKTERAQGGEGHFSEGLSHCRGMTPTMAHRTRQSKFLSILLVHIMLSRCFAKRMLIECNRVCCLRLWHHPADDIECELNVTKREPDDLLGRQEDTGQPGGFGRFETGYFPAQSNGVLAHWPIRKPAPSGYQSRAQFDVHLPIVNLHPRRCRDEQSYRPISFAFITIYTFDFYPELAKPKD